MQTHFDTIVIGGGPGGLAAAYSLAEQQSVLVAENDLWGGTCPNRGCDPKKMLYSAVEILDQQQALQAHGLRGKSTINWSELMAFKRHYTQQVPENTLNGLQSAGIQTITGTAHFVDSQTLQINKINYTAAHFIIATGQTPTIPTIDGQEFLQTSNQFLDLKHLPDKIAFIGAGYIAIELANIAVTAGAEVHIIQHNNRILRDFPVAMTSELVTSLQNKGVQFHFGTTVTGIHKSAKGLTLNNPDGLMLTVNAVFAAMGRKPNIAQLALEKAGVTTSNHGIQVDDHLMSSNPRIYAIGDVVDRPQPKLTPVAGFEARYVAGQLLQTNTTAIAYPLIPHTVYASPQISQVGITVKTAQDNPRQYRIKQQTTTNWYTFNRIKESNAIVTTIFERQTNQLVGAAAYTTLAEELINYFTTLIKNQTTATELTDTIYNYPSPASDLKYYY
ncbi:dihydrolipoyl dehydrogenase family protein [Latilactobacillus graminis]|uniref:Glutathione reductase n=2 Tax=Latilactobacillus graminis TaxID=60519 RepID=A0AA89I6M3_9LACO|nr:NAD(P)/FAD-dependent oxidoreductase [Latilactobacillus graminis]KRM24188.1 glutathione reductase [Latilactobacillus graminis DSM 20719]QFP78829.1 NAD(P)/FAD-dependent oxidoreductase [Latilactobacillus graminis]